MTISCQPDGRPPQPVRPRKSGRVHLAEGSNVVVLELPYSTEFGRESRKFASVVRKYGKFSQFLTHPVVYGGQGKNKYCLLESTANVYRLSRVKVSGTCVQPFQRYRLRSANFDKNNNMTRGSRVCRPTFTKPSTRVEQPSVLNKFFFRITIFCRVRA